jgi:hypothetical protein
MEEEKTVVAYGGTVKALPGGKLGGYLVTFGGTDLSGEYFTKDTDFGEYGKLPVLYHHGLNSKIGTRRIGTAEITMDDVAGLLLICQTDYESGRSLFTRPHATRRRTAKIYRKLKRLTTDQAIGTALDYFASCTETPERWTEEKKGRGIAAPLCHHIVLCLCSQFNFAHVEAWNHRYCDARCMMEAWREREGDTSLLTPYQKQLVAEAERIKAAAQKETATT